MTPAIKLVMTPGAMDTKQLNPQFHPIGIVPQISSRAHNFLVKWSKVRYVTNDHKLHWSEVNN